MTKIPYGAKTRSKLVINPLDPAPQPDPIANSTHSEGSLSIHISLPDHLTSRSRLIRLFHFLKARLRLTNKQIESKSDAPANNPSQDDNVDDYDSDFFDLLD